MQLLTSIAIILGVAVAFAVLVGRPHDPASNPIPAPAPAPAPATPRPGFRLREFGWAILGVAVFLALFRDEIRERPWAMARSFLMQAFPWLVAFWVMPLVRAASPRLVAWGAARPGRIGRVAAWAGDYLVPIAVACLLVAYATLGPGLDEWLRGRGW